MVKVERTYDIDKIEQIVLSMIDDVIEDDTPYGCFEVKPHNDCWLSLNDYEALFYVEAFNRTTLDIHCYVPKENRDKSLDYGIAAMRWVRDESPSMYKKVITQAPSLYPHIKKYVEKLGFKEEGRYKKAFTKNKERHDLIMFGIERGDIR